MEVAKISFITLQLFSLLELIFWKYAIQIFINKFYYGNDEDGSAITNIGKMQRGNGKMVSSTLAGNVRRRSVWKHGEEPSPRLFGKK